MSSVYPHTFCLTFFLLLRTSRDFLLSTHAHCPSHVFFQFGNVCFVQHFSPACYCSFFQTVIIANVILFDLVCVLAHHMSGSWSVDVAALRRQIGLVECCHNRLSMSHWTSSIHCNHSTAAASTLRTFSASPAQVHNFICSPVCDTDTRDTLDPMLHCDCRVSPTCFLCCTVKL